jgi:hypothetical protein
LETAVLLVRVANWRFLATHDAKGPSVFKENVEKAQAALSALENNEAAAGVRQPIAPVRPLFSNYNASFAQASAAILAANKLYDGTMQAQFAEIETDGATAQQTLDADLADVQQNTDAALSSIIVLQSLLAIVGLLLGIALASLIVGGIVGPLSGMTAVMRRGEPTLSSPSLSRRTPARSRSARACRRRACGPARRRRRIRRSTSPSSATRSRFRMWRS